ncbi:MAG: hypothetical protein HYX34_03255 [Actinobacteria bacterium]|nr:hypothetical protein [Actinomycetota bacterium]
MGAERFVVLGLAGARSPWFTDVARWATVGAIPVEFVKCISVEELRANLASGRPFSAVLIDAGTGVVDRDLVDLASTRQVAVVVVDDGRARADWSLLGAAAVVPAAFDRAALLDVLGAHARMIGGGTVLPTDEPAGSGAAPAAGARFVAVTGSGGSGASTAAVALAQGLAEDSGPHQVVLADLRLQADLAMLHDARDIVPGVQELVEAHRGGRPTPEEVLRLTFEVVNRNYRLLLGLRRHRDWAALRPRAFEAALDGLQRTFSVVVADIDADLEGEAECGSTDVEERNLMARTAVARAEAVVAVGAPGMKGLHALVRTINELREHGVEGSRILAVVNRSPRNQRARAELTRALADLVGAGGAPAVVGPVHLADRRGLDDLHRDGARLPSTLATPLARAVGAVIERAGATPPRPVAAPVPIVPGRVGAWAEQAAPS